MKRGALQPRGGQVWVCSALQQQVHDLHVPKHRRQVQWRESLFLDPHVHLSIRSK